MNKIEKLKQFFEQLRGKAHPSAQDIRNAAAATGNITEIVPDILSYAYGMGINAATELADLASAQEEARQAETLRQTAESLAEKSGALAVEADLEKRQELIKDIRKNAVALEPSSNSSFQFVRIDSLKVSAPSWLVKGLIETDSFGCLFGDPAAGKSFLAIELSSCIVTGTPFYGLPVKQGPVIYLAGEGQSGLARRFRAWSIARNVSLNGVPLYINRRPVSLIDDKSMLDVVQALERLILEIGRPPALAILDTWSRVLGGDDSSPSDAQAGVAALDDLRSRFGNFAALVVHHEGHAKGRGRGWSGLRAAVDVELRAERGNDKILRLECTKAKDTEPIEPMAFQFSTVELGFDDEDGNMVESAVLTPTGWTPAPDVTAKKPLGKNQEVSLDILKRLEAAGSVTVEAWREACIVKDIDRKRFAEIKEILQKAGLVNINNLLCSSSVPAGMCPSVRPTDPLLYKGVGSDGRSDKHHTKIRNISVSDTSDVSDKNPMPVEDSTPSNAPELFQDEKSGGRP